MTPSRTQLAHLTERDTQVITLLFLGLTTEGIARELGLSPDTIEDHVARISWKLGVSGRGELFTQARDLSELPMMRKSA